MNNITSGVLVNAQQEYNAGGCPISVSSKAAIIGEVKIATAHFENDVCTLRPRFGNVIPGEEVLPNHPVAKVTGLKVIDPNLGAVILAETQLSYLEKLNACCIPAV